MIRWRRPGYGILWLDAVSPLEDTVKKIARDYRWQGRKIKRPSSMKMGGIFFRWVNRPQAISSNLRYPTTTIFRRMNTTQPYWHEVRVFRRSILDFDLGR